MPIANEPKEGWVYLLRCEQWYKVGITAGSVEDRRTQLQTGNPFGIYLVHYAYSFDMRTTELLLHCLYAAKRGRGEWFSLSTNDVLFLCKTITWTMKDHMVLSDMLVKSQQSVHLKRGGDKFFDREAFLNDLLGPGFNIRYEGDDAN